MATGVAVTAAILAWWLGGCLVGWWRARRGDDATLASRGGARWWGGILALLAANVGAGLALGLMAADGALPSEERLSAGLDLLTVASNLWVLMYYRVPRRWDGRRP